jgi:hypothetical protein
VSGQEHLCFDYVSHETPMIRFLYRKPNLDLQFQMTEKSNAQTYIFQTQRGLVKFQLGLLTGTINSSLGLDSLLTKNVQFYGDFKCTLYSKKSIKMYALHL